MRTFDSPADEQPYLDWLDANPAGLVVNTTRPDPSPTYLRLHAATCKTISVPRPGRDRFTSGDYQKFCSRDRAELEAWALTVGGPLNPCQLCYP